MIVQKVCQERKVEDNSLALKNVWMQHNDYLKTALKSAKKNKNKKITTNDTSQ